MTLIAVLAIGAFALADVLVSNLTEPERAATAIGNNPNSVIPPGANKSWYWAAQSFTTDGSPYTLTSIEAIVGDSIGSPTPPAFAELRADAGGAIGATIATFIVPDLSGPRSPRPFVPTAPVQLDPNTTYWFVQGIEIGANDGGHLWSYTETGFFTGPGALGQWAFSSDSGAFWTYGAEFPFQIAVNVSTTPPDSDGDGVADPDDQCPSSPPDAIVDGAGRSLGDFDLDCDVDLDDFAIFQNNFTGPG